MPIFRSQHPEIDLPTDITIFEWLFGETSKYSPLNRFPKEQLAGYLDASTEQRLSWAEVKEAATLISTALQRNYGFQAGDTLSLFSRNSIWYPVTLFAAIRIGRGAAGIPLMGDASG
jgi:4-coumarate--CoA ligase